MTPKHPDFDILLVDDNTSLRSLLAEYLEACGYRVASASGGRDALRQLQSKSVRMVITDIFMPETDGFELIMHLRKSAPNLGIVAMSGDGSADPTMYLKTARQFGVRRSLQKPFPLGELLEAVHGVIGEASPSGCAA